MGKFAERLKELRIENGLSMNALANKVGYSHTAIADWENKTRTPNIDVLLNFAKFFKVSADYLLGLEN